MGIRPLGDPQILAVSPTQRTGANTSIVYTPTVLKNVWVIDKGVYKRGSVLFRVAAPVEHPFCKFPPL